MSKILAWQIRAMRTGNRCVTTPSATVPFITAIPRTARAAGRAVPAQDSEIVSHSLSAAGHY